MLRSSLDLIDRASVPMDACEVDRLLVFRRDPRSPLVMPALPDSAVFQSDRRSDRRLTGSPEWSTYVVKELERFSQKELMKALHAFRTELALLKLEVTLLATVVGLLTSALVQFAAA
jgi:hypothetical protein